jgi:hypothetical protein
MPPLKYTYVAIRNDLNYNLAMGIERSHSMFL